MKQSEATRRAPEHRYDERQRSLYLRLEDGYSRIEQALAAGRDTTRWEDLWIQLLDEYERVSDQAAERAAA